MATRHITPPTTTKLKSTFKSHSKRRSKQGDITDPCSKSGDVSVLYAGNPIRMVSTTSSVTPPFHRKSPTYLGIYREQLQSEEQSISRSETLSILNSNRKDFPNISSGDMESCKTLPSLCVESSDSAFNESLEWDYSSHQCLDICTQTSPTVITVDRASSSFPIESLSKESLLENQTKPLSVIYMEQTTEPEESDGEDNFNGDIGGDQDIQSHPAPKETKCEIELGKKSNVIFNLENGSVPAAPPNGDFPAKCVNGNNVCPDLPSQEYKKEMTYCVHTHSKSDKSIHHFEKPTTVGHHQRNSAPSLQDWQAELMPKLNTSPCGKAIEILPSPAPLTLNELKMNYCASENLESKDPAVTLSMKSSLILQPSHTKHGIALKSSYEIFNSTSFLQGYKILVNAAANNRLRVSPSMGIISPHGLVTVHFSTNSNECSNEALAKCRIAVKTFRVHCKDPKKLKEYYTKLEDQHPELIQVKAIDRVLVWDNKDLPEMMSVMHSVSDICERELLKEQLHQHLSKDMMMIQTKLTSPKQQLNSIKTAMMVANQNLNNVFLELNVIRNTLGFLSFIGIIVYGIAFILPAFQENETTAGVLEMPPPATIEAEVITQSAESYLQLVWEKFQEIFDSYFLTERT